MNFSVSNATIDDLPNIIELVNSVDGDLEEAYPGQFVIVREHNTDKLIGCGRLKDYFYFAEVASIAVNKKYRHQNVGKKIVESLIEKNSEEYDDIPIYLLCNNENIKFFEKGGFSLLEKCPIELWTKLNRYPDSNNVMGLCKT